MNIESNLNAIFINIYSMAIIGYKMSFGRELFNSAQRALKSDSRSVRERYATGTLKL